MANNDKILYKRANLSKPINEQTANPNINAKNANNKIQGVLVIDPNKSVNESNQIVDRYIKQEDLMIYTNLKVVKRSQTSIAIDKNDKKTEKKDSEAIYINFLNPLKNNTNNNRITKNKFTSEWTDFFTSDSANDKNSPNYLLDPETFGITDINIAINANQIPIIQMTFTDVQGRMLFERGNDVDNPYNIFYTLPYPKFLLTYKGYYGKAVELQLVLLKTNTTFDPSTGNYNITAEFQGDVFSIFNTFLLIYGYTAPYMFKLEDGTYLGGKILEQLYTKQNEAIKKNVDEQSFSKYQILGNPSLWDLASSLKKIPGSVIKNSEETTESVQNNDKILNFKTLIESYDQTIQDYFNTNASEKYRDVSTTTLALFEAINDSNLITNTAPLDLLSFIKDINKNINEIGKLTLPGGGSNTVLAKIINSIKGDKSIVGVNIQSTIGDFELKPNVFYSSGDPTNRIYQLDTYNKILSYVYKELSDLQIVIEDDYLEDQIRDIGVLLGFEPNLNNVIRIISNNMQTFLILLEIIGKNSLNQIKVDNSRVNKQLNNSDYTVSSNRNEKFLTAFPNYYKNIKETINGKSIDRKILTYPGIDASAAKWFEVAFVEEIYKALDVIKTKANPKDTATHELKKTGLTSIFQLGEIDLDVYNQKNESNKILGELLSKYNLYTTYSGLFYHGIEPSNFKSSISNSLADFELSLLDTIVFNKMATNIKITIADQIKNATKLDAGLTNLGNFAINFIGFNGGLEGVKEKLLPEIKKGIDTISKKYTKSQFDATFNNLNKKVNENITDRQLYNTITYNNINNIYNYSVNSDNKTNTISFYIDLKNNDKYYCDNSDLLGNIGTVYQSVVDTNSDTNPFQGFYQNMNKFLKDVNFNINFSNDVKFKRKSVPSLTFNTKTTDINEPPFKKISETKSYYKKYNKL